MPTPRVLILRAPGTNCDRETAFAFELAGSQTELFHINDLLDSPRRILDFQILCIPGGFSYGDDIAAGRILANQIRHHLFEVLDRFRRHGKLLLGICNGFQVLMQSGFLLDSDEAGSPATLTWNDSGHFVDRWTHLTAEGDRCVFLQDAASLYLPVAHAEGKFVARDPATQQRLEGTGQLVLRYAQPKQTSGAPSGASTNPNGAQGNVAGVCDSTGRVLGLMPHPERHVDPTHHPRWSRGEAAEEGDGLQLFRNAVQYFA